MKKILFSLIILFSLLGFFCTPSITDAAYVTTFLNTPVSGASYCPGTPITFSGSAGWVDVCSNWVGSVIPLTITISGTAGGANVSLSAGGGLTVGSSTFSVTVDIPADASVGSNSVTASWSTPIYQKGGGYKETDSASYTVPINIRGGGGCGSADGLSTSSAPTANLCANGASPTSGVTGSGPWYWTCTNSCSGGTIQCSSYLKVSANGICGTNALIYPAGSTSFQGTFCGNNVPVSSTPVFPLPTASGSITTWLCPGIGGGTAATCKATLQASGNCGTAVQ